MIIIKSNIKTDKFLNINDLKYISINAILKCDIKKIDYEDKHGYFEYKVEFICNKNIEELKLKKILIKLIWKMNCSCIIFFYS